MLRDSRRWPSHTKGPSPEPNEGRLDCPFQIQGDNLRGCGASAIDLSFKLSALSPLGCGRNQLKPVCCGVVCLQAQHDHQSWHGQQVLLQQGMDIGDLTSKTGDQTIASLGLSHAWFSMLEPGDLIPQGTHDDMDLREFVQANAPEVCSTEDDAEKVLQPGYMMKCRSQSGVLAEGFIMDQIVNILSDCKPVRIRAAGFALLGSLSKQYMCIMGPCNMCSGCVTASFRKEDIQNRRQSSPHQHL